MRRLRRLTDCTKGATVLEFALVAPVFLMLLFGIIDGSRLFWTKKTLDEVAFSTARCISVSSTCDTTAKQKAYAVQRARSYGIRVTTADVAIGTKVTCRSQSNSNRVTITTGFASGLRGLLPMPKTLNTVGCFPVVA